MEETDAQSEDRLEQATPDSTPDVAETDAPEASEANGDDRGAATEYVAVMEAAAEGDLTARMDPDGADGDLAAVAEGFNEMMDSLETTVMDIWEFSGEVRNSGSSVASSVTEIEAASERVNRSIEEISERTDEQTRNLEAVSAEMDDISATIEEVAASTQEVAETAERAVDRGEEGQEAAERAIEAIDRVETASDEVVERIEELESQMSEVDAVVESITDIADQTNLLALNANIEAARAGGDDGSGFAVVADEVKALAEETKDAAGEIEAILVDAQDRTERTVTDVQETSESISTGATTIQEALEALTEIVDRIDEANDGIQEISDAVDDHAAANQQILDQVTEVADLARSINERADTVADAAERQTRSISGISRRTDDLRERVTALEGSLTEFALNEWGERINEYCRRAGIDWRQFEGTTLTFGVVEHPFTRTTRPLLDHFADLTGIEVEYETYPEGGEEQLLADVEADMDAGGGRFDGFYLGLWPSAKYHANGWVRDLTTYLEDASLTDRDWYHMEDYPEGVIDPLTHGGELIALPFGVEVYGCLAYDRPTFQKLGLDEPTDFESLLHAAKTIDESPEIDRVGICSRGVDGWLGTTNWASMFGSYGAEWIDYDRREAALDSPAGVESLELYAELLGEYGPADAGSHTWLDAAETYGAGEAGMLYHAPSTFGVIPDEQYDRTKWLPPLEGPDGRRVASNWAWSLGISRFSENPAAAWLFLQWATCRPANLLASTDQWRGQESYGWARANWVFDQPEYGRRGQKDSWVEAHRRGVQLVPTDPPAVPLHTPQNAEIMNRAGAAMHAAIEGEKTAEAALGDAARDITEIAREIPADYL